MEVHRAAPRLFAIGCLLLLGAVLFNQMLLASDSQPAQSWAEPEVEGEQTRLRMTFQTGPGDRLSIDVARSLFALGLPPQVPHIRAHLYETPAGDAGPDVSQRPPARVYEGQLVDNGTRGTVLLPPPPVWQVRGQQWWTYEVVVEFSDASGATAHGRPGAQRLMDRFVDDAPFGPRSSPYQAIPDRALDWQPALYGVQFLLSGGIVASAVWAVRGRTGVPPGLEGGLRLAAQARQWLATLYTMLWIALLGLFSLVATLALLMAGVEMAMRPALAPDAFYPVWVNVVLVGVLLGGGSGVAMMLLRVRRALRRVPALEAELDLDA